MKYAKVNGQWNISGKGADSRGNSLVTATYGTPRASGYRLLEDALNLKDTKIFDTVVEDGKEKRVLNKKRNHDRTTKAGDDKGSLQGVDLPGH